MMICMVHDFAEAVVGDITPGGEDIISYTCTFILIYTYDDTL
jgi:hypothetical protein